MKKLFDSKFLIISALSIVTLILLIVFSFFLFDRDEAKFAKSGYIINPLSSTSEKYFFDGGTGYRENLSSMVVFNDVDSHEVKVVRDSFAHYEDDSISLLKNGAVLDINSIHDNLALIYNISSESMIEKDNDGYHIESLNGDVKLKNFIVRISDNKYMIVGDVKLSYSGSSSLVDGDYFEIVYSEEGIVNVENKKFKYELSADGTYVIIGDYKIDLGTKVLSYRDNDVMSITAITIDGNENVEIIPKKEEPKESSSSSQNGSSSDNTPSGSSSSSPSPSSSSNSSSSDGGEGGSSGGSGGGSVERINAPKVSLKEAVIGSTNVEVVFDIENKDENDNYMLQVINADTGNTVDITAEVLPDVRIDVNLLTPSTKYLFTVVNRETKEQYFQKVFKTDSFGISLDKAYATSDSLTYKLTVGSDAQVSDATLTLYKFDEELGDRVETGKVVRLSQIPTNSDQEEYYIPFDGLDSDSIYVAVLDNFSLESVNFRDVYNISVTSLTLKKTPIFPNEKTGLMSITEGDTADNFKLYIGDIEDPDNAITKYTYSIYDTNETVLEDDDTLALPVITKDNASPITVNLGQKNTELHTDTNYYYRAVIEYYDNEKYVEYETVNSSYFIKTGNPTVTVVPNSKDDEDKITHNQIAAKVYLNDKGCKIKLDERPGVDCSGSNVLKVRITKINNNFGNDNQDDYKEFTVDSFVFEGESVYYKLVVGDLEAGTTYAINTYTYDDDGALVKIPHASDSTKTITTLTLADFRMLWTNPDSGEKVIKLDSQLEGIVREDAIGVDESASKMSKVILYLYDGDVRDTVAFANPIATKEVTGNIKSLFYDNAYTITNDGTFGVTKEYLENRNSNHKLSRQYTIMARVFYGTVGEINLVENTQTYLYNVPITIIEDDITQSDIIVDTIKNKKIGNFFDKVGDETVVGYLVHGVFINDIRVDINNVTFRVYDENNNLVKFYVKENGNINLNHPINEIKHTNIEGIEDDFEIYIDYGVDYNNPDNIMRRGNKYTLGYCLDVVEVDNNNIVGCSSVSGESWPGSYGASAVVTPSKDTPSVGMYASISTADSIKYKYYINDPDNAIYKASSDDNYSLYYSVNDGEENRVDLTENTNNRYNGDFTISDLHIGDIYKIYYKLNILKTGEDDIANAKIDDNLRFDGYVDASSLNSKYNVVNQPGTNRAAIIILSDDILFNNTLSYTMTFRDQKRHEESIDVNPSELMQCDDAYDISGNRCYFIDYAKLKEWHMKSDGSNNEVNQISVGVTVVYDTGLGGYDTEFDDYIIKETSRGDTESKYFILNSGGNIVPWTRESNTLPGYYEFKKHVNSSTGIIEKIDLRNKMTNVQNKNIDLVLKNYGYVREADSMSGSIIPHEVKIENMSMLDNNKFFFSSITPKAAPVESSKVSFLSGVGMDLKVSGIDLTDFVLEDNKYHLYIEVWEKASDVGDLSKTAMPRKEIVIDENTGNLISGIDITGLHSYHATNYPEYYCQIYAQMYVNSQSTYVQLKDYDTDALKTYKFKTKGTSNILLSDNIELNVDEDGNDLSVDYGERFLTTTFNLAPYANGYGMDYGLEYYVCYSDSLVCDSSDNILSKTIAKDDVSTSIKNTFNAYSYDLTYGTDYKMYTYAKFLVYERNGNGFDETYQTVLLKKPTTSNYVHNIRELREPTFQIMREAKYLNGDYVIDLTVNVSDPDRVLQPSGNTDYGVYNLYIRDGNELVGNLQKLSDNLVINNYSEYPFNASEINQQFRVDGDLEENTEYKVQACGDVYTKNLGIEEAVHRVCSRNYSAYTSDSNGIALGKIQYYPTQTSIKAVFTGGSSLRNNINKLYYTILDQDNGREYLSPSDGYIIGPDKASGESHYFEYEREEYRLTLLNGMNNKPDQLFTVSMSLYDKNNRLYTVPIDENVRYIVDKDN